MVKEQFEYLLNLTTRTFAEEAEAWGWEVDESITQAEVPTVVKKLLNGETTS